MLGKRTGQRGLWEADHLYLDMVGRDTFYGLLAGLRGLKRVLKSPCSGKMAAPLARPHCECQHK